MEDSSKRRRARREDGPWRSGRVADTYAGSDVVAARWRWCGCAYPFVEMHLRAAYPAGAAPVAKGVVSVAVRAVGTVGVVSALPSAEDPVRPPDGGVNLPMSYVTLGEDVMMAGMAAAMVLAGGYP